MKSVLPFVQMTLACVLAGCSAGLIASTVLAGITLLLATA